MAAEDRHKPDWRNASAFEPLLNADRSLIAWEWLRRDPAYRAAAERAIAGDCCDPGVRDAPGRWGLHAFEPPGLAAPDARPVWNALVHPYVLEAEAGPPDGEDVFELERFAAISTLVKAPDRREHLLISDGLRAIRIDVIAGTLAAGPVSLRFRLTGPASAERPVLTLRRLLAFWRTGRFCSSVHPREARAKRWTLLLRVHDALAEGADQREIAAVLLSPQAGEPLWRSRSPSVRTQSQRLVRGARSMASGAYLGLLR